MLAATGGVGVESERLVAVLERAVGALELLATLPTPETSVSLDAFLLDSHDGGHSAVALPQGAHETLAAHFRLEASLAKEATERQQRRASQRSASVKESVRDVPERPEVDEADGFEEGDNDSEGQDGVAAGRDDYGDDDSDDEDDGWDHDDALRFPRSLHRVLDLLSRDKPTRDTLRRQSATRISPDVAAFVHALTDLIVLRERALQTTPEQDELQQRRLRDAAQRLVELQDDAAQLRFELAAEREARQAHALTHVKSISQLREQLSETQRHASEALRATQRTRDHDAQALRAQFETDTVGVREKALALARLDGRVADAHQAEESDDRKRVARAVADLHDLLAKYDDEMTALDDELARATDEMLDGACDVARLATYFERVDEDRHHQLVEQRAREAEDARRRRRELNLFKFITRLQAVVRGFLTRRRVRLDEKLRKRRKTKKKKKKTTSKTSSPKKKNNTTAAGIDKGSSSTTAPRKPSRPASATGKTPRRPSSAAVRR